LNVASTPATVIELPTAISLGVRSCSTAKLSIRYLLVTVYVAMSG